MVQIESRTRSWVKSIVWRIIGIFLLGAIAYAVTGNWEQVSIITLIFHTVRIVLYYVHERIWDRVSWGRALHPLADLPVTRSLSPEHRQELVSFLHTRGYLENPVP